MPPLSGNQRLDLLTSLMNMSLVLRLPGEIHLCGSSSHVPRLPTLLEMQKKTCFAHFWQSAESLAPATQNHILNSKSAPRPSVFNTFDFWTAKSGPRLRCFVHFDFETRFAPQRRALFEHLNFQKYSERGVLCTFWLRNVLRVTTACTFSTSQLAKVLRAPQFSTLLTYKRASRDHGVHFFDIWTSKSGPRLKCFVHFDFEMCFALQQRALFEHLNFQKYSEPVSFHTFDFQKICFAPPQWRAIFHLSSGHMAPHPPL